MFKKMFGPKKYEREGEPVPVDDLRDALREYFPQEGEMINQYLTIQKTDKTHSGFAAVWEYYIRDSDSEGMKSNYFMKYTVLVDIRPEEHAVYFKGKRFARTKRVPKEETVYDPWFTEIRVGKLEDLKVEKSSSFKVFSAKKILKKLVEQTTGMGWDAYLLKI